uniref:Uncharacterized protein n=1 Tax=Alexandrium monilatum TaxID=311494 RepID=A0A7S4VJZ7_9DINO
MEECRDRSPAADSSDMFSPVAASGISNEARLPAEGLWGLAKASAGYSSARSPSSGLHGKQVQERDIYSSVRRQMEVLEERLNGQIVRVQQHGERSRDSALTRLDSKVSTMELLQPKVDRRIAEINGNLKALSEESQTQIRRMDQMDSRHWEWRHKLEEEIRGKLAGMETANQELASSFRVTKAANEEVLKRHHQRLLRLEELVDEGSKNHEDLNSNLMNMHTRLLEIENDSPALRSSSDPKDPLSDVNTSAGLVIVESQVQDLSQKVTQLLEESYEMRAKLEAQEEHHKTLRTQVEAKDELIRGLEDRINRENWEGRLKELQRGVDGISSSNHGHSEQVQILNRKLESHEEVHSELSGHIRRLQDRAPAVFDHIGSTPPRTPAASPAGSPSAKPFGDVPQLPGADNSGVPRSIGTVHDRLQELQSKVDSMQVEMNVAPRVAELVDTLKELSPKIISQGQAIEELHAKVATFEERLPQEASTVQANEDFEPRVAALAEKLQEVHPRFAVHDESIKDLHAKVDAVEGELNSVNQSLTKRLGPLQAEVRDIHATQAELRGCTDDLLSRACRLENEVRAQEKVKHLVDDHTTRLDRLENEVHGDPDYQAELRVCAEDLMSRSAVLEKELGSQAVVSAPMEQPSLRESLEQPDLPKPLEQPDLPKPLEQSDLREPSSAVGTESGKALPPGDACSTSSSEEFADMDGALQEAELASQGHQLKAAEAAKEDNESKMAEEAGEPEAARTHQRDLSRSDDEAEPEHPRESRAHREARELEESKAEEVREAEAELERKKQSLHAAEEAREVEEELERQWEEWEARQSLKAAEEAQQMEAALQNNPLKMPEKPRRVEALPINTPHFGASGLAGPSESDDDEVPEPLTPRRHVKDKVALPGSSATMSEEEPMSEAASLASPRDPENMAEAPRPAAAAAAPLASPLAAPSPGSSSDDPTVVEEAARGNVKAIFEMLQEARAEEVAHRNSQVASPRAGAVAPAAPAAAKVPGEEDGFEEPEESEDPGSPREPVQLENLVAPFLSRVYQAPQ